MRVVSISSLDLERKRINVFLKMLNSVVEFSKMTEKYRKKVFHFLLTSKRNKRLKRKRQMEELMGNLPVSACSLLAASLNSFCSEMTGMTDRSLKQSDRNACARVLARTQRSGICS